MNEEESSPVKLDEPSLKKAAQVWPQLKVLQKPLTSMYHTLPSQASNTRSNMTLVEYQPSLQLCFLRTYPKPGPMIVEKARAQAAADTDLLTGLDHPHVIKCLEVLEDKKNFYVVTEALVRDEDTNRLGNRTAGHFKPDCSCTNFCNGRNVQVDENVKRNSEICAFPS